MKLPKLDWESKSGLDLLSIGGGAGGGMILADLLLTGGAISLTTAAWFGAAAGWGGKKVLIDAPVNYLASRKSNRRACEKANFLREMIHRNVKKAQESNLSEALIRQLDDLEQDVHFETDPKVLEAFLLKSRELRDKATSS
ncbi:MAG: hypothetical protein MK104_03240 [Erythrobacter sp.]|nr:hypothetical protein [Erythrobacter sp.]